MCYESIKSSSDGFINLYKLQIRSFKKDLFNCDNKDLKILMIAGGDDSVIGSSKFFDDLRLFLKSIGYADVNSKLYANLRHELLNEEDYMIVYSNILDFFDNYI